MPVVSLSQVAVHLRAEDNVAIAAKHLPQGTEIGWNGHTLVLDRRVGMGHKLALTPIREGDAILKYGQIIGFAGTDIAPGAHVHVHNVRADAFERDYAFCRDIPAPQPAAEPRFFQGYDR